MPCEPPASASGSYISHPYSDAPLFSDQGAFLVVGPALAAALNAVHVLDLDHLVPDELDVTRLFPFVVALQCPQAVVPPLAGRRSPAACWRRWLPRPSGGHHTGSRSAPRPSRWPSERRACATCCSASNGGSFSCGTLVSSQVRTSSRKARSAPVTVSSISFLRVSCATCRRWS